MARNRADARWLPTRCNLAIFRLYAFLRMRFAKPDRRETLMLPIDRYQSSFETHCVAAILFIITAIYLAAMLARWMPLFAALAIAPVVTPLFLQIPLWLVGSVATLAGGENNKRLISGSIVAMLVAWSVVQALASTWTRWPARIFLALVLANLAAMPVAWLLRHRFEALEDSCAG